MNAIDALNALSPEIKIALGVLVVVQVVLDVVALRDLYKRPLAQVVFANKWIWVAIILLVNTIGPILYLTAGHTPAAATEKRPATPAGTRASDAADLLYGERKDADPR